MTKSETLHVRIEPALKKKLQKAAKADTRDLSNFILHYAERMADTMEKNQIIVETDNNSTFVIHFCKKHCVVDMSVCGTYETLMKVVSEGVKSLFPNGGKAEIA